MERPAVTGRNTQTETLPEFPFPLGETGGPLRPRAFDRHRVGDAGPPLTQIRHRSPGAVDPGPASGGAMLTLLQLAQTKRFDISLLVEDCGASLQTVVAARGAQVHVHLWPQSAHEPNDAKWPTRSSRPIDSAVR
jgi:hypothetical protein